MLSVIERERESVLACDRENSFGSCGGKSLQLGGLWKFEHHSRYVYFVWKENRKKLIYDVLFHLIIYLLTNR